MSASRRVSPSERFRARVDELFNSGRELGQILAPPRQDRRQPWPGRRLRAGLQREPAPALRRAHVARNVIAKVSQLDQEAVKKDYWAAGAIGALVAFTAVGHLPGVTVPVPAAVAVVLGASGLMVPQALRWLSRLQRLYT